MEESDIPLEPIGDDPTLPIPLDGHWELNPGMSTSCNDVLQALGVNLFLRSLYNTLTGTQKIQKGREGEIVIQLAGFLSGGVTTVLELNSRDGTQQPRAYDLIPGGEQRTATSAWVHKHNVLETRVTVQSAPGVELIIQRSLCSTCLLRETMTLTSIRSKAPLISAQRLYSRVSTG